MGLTAPEPHGTPSIEVDLETLIREINEIGRRIESQGTSEVVLFNDDDHAFEDVVRIVHYATGCTIRRAYEITQRANDEGQATAFQGMRDDCERIAAIFRKVELGCAVV